MEKFSWSEIGIIVTMIGGLFGVFIKVISYLVKKWMNDREQQEANIRAELFTITAKIAHDLADRHDEAVKDIKDKIAGNREYYVKSYGDISAQIKEMDIRLVQRMDVANGRTGKLEDGVHEITEKCEKRSKGFYIATENLKPVAKKKRGK